MIDVFIVASVLNLKNDSETIVSGLEDNILDLEKEIPRKNIFGVFTTIVRSQILNKWPKDIHGCLGYWSNDYSKMGKNTIVRKIIQLGYDTSFNDNRREYFKRDLSEDSGAYIEISYMLLPIKEVKNGMIGNKKFNNTDYGLIVDSGGKRATYLPKVFGNIEWEELRQSLMGKAGMNSGENSRFYGYKTDVVRVPIYGTLFSGKFQEVMEYPVKKFYWSIYDKGILPFAVINGKIKEEIEEAIRNLGTLGDMIRVYGSDNGDIIRYLEYYYGKFIENRGRYRQASAFLLEDYYLLNIYPERRKEIVDYLYKNLNKMEPRFELGEVLKILAIVEPKKEVFEKEARKMYKRLEDMGDELDNVFELNWQSQFMEKARIESRERNGEKIGEVMLRILGSKYGKLETNYWAVIYECLSNLVKIVENEELKNKRMEYFIKLNSRIGKYGLYYFKGMKEARLDITGHIIFQTN